MKKSKKTTLKIPVKFSGDLHLDPSNVTTFQSAIDRGEIAFDLELSNPDSGMSMNYAVYQDSFEGNFSVKIIGDKIQLALDGVCAMEYGEFERENIPLPLTVKAYSISDAEPTSLYFGEDECGVSLLQIDANNLVAGST